MHQPKRTFQRNQFMKQVGGASNWLSGWVRDSPVLCKVGPGWTTEPQHTSGLWWLPSPHAGSRLPTRSWPYVHTSVWWRPEKKVKIRLSIPLSQAFLQPPFFILLQDYLGQVLDQRIMESWGWRRHRLFQSAHLENKVKVKTVSNLENEIIPVTRLAQSVARRDCSVHAVSVPTYPRSPGSPLRFTSLTLELTRHLACVDVHSLSVEGQKQIKWIPRMRVYFYYWSRLWFHGCIYIPFLIP